MDPQSYDFLCDKTVWFSKCLFTEHFFKAFPFFFFFLNLFLCIFHWSIVDLQYCVSFRCTAEWFSYISIIFQIIFHGLPSYLSQFARICLQCRRPKFNSWVGKIPWRRKWQPTLGFLPGDFLGQRSLEGYSLWDGKDSDMTEWLTLFTWQSCRFSHHFHPFWITKANTVNSCCFPLRLMKLWKSHTRKAAVLLVYWLVFCSQLS